MRNLILITRKRAYDNLLSATILLLFWIQTGTTEDVTSTTFSYTANENIYPVAFGDYDSNKFTDMVALVNDSSAFEIYLGLNFPPYLVQSSKIPRCYVKFPTEGTKKWPIKIVGIVLADFNGDSVSDILVSFFIEGDTGDKTIVQIYKGDLEGRFSCKDKLLLNGTADYLELTEEPLVVDLNGDTVADLFGETFVSRDKKFWIFNRQDELPHEFMLRCDNCDDSVFSSPLTSPTVRASATAFLDLDGDFNPELVMILTRTSPSEQEPYHDIVVLTQPEIVAYRHEVHWHILYNHSLPRPINRVGNPLGLDMSLNGKLGLLIPICTDTKCKTSEFLLYEPYQALKGRQVLRYLNVKLTDEHGRQFTFISAAISPIFGQTINFYVGDYNLDGYPDLIGAVQQGRVSASEGSSRAVLLKNVPDEDNPGKRTFLPDFNFLQDYSQTQAAFFFDLKEDGLLDIMMVGKGRIQSGTDKKNIRKSDIVSAYQNIPEYDAYFIKWIVTTSSCVYRQTCPQYNGVRAPGASMTYATTDLDIKLQTSAATQNMRSHFALDFPYTVMGTGKSANFIENVHFGITSGITYPKTQIIPNSILIAIPPSSDQSASRWEVKQLINPSLKGASNTFYALMVICLGIGSGVFVLWLRERKEDKLFVEQQKNKPMSLASITFA